MIAVLTGDIIGSRKQKSVQTWLEPLKQLLNTFGSAPKHWEIFQGDSFQLEVKPKEALLKAIHIKSCICRLNNLDVRIAIGLGNKSFNASSISESNGSAFVHSGETLKALKSLKQNMKLKSDDDSFDHTFNLMLKLALMAMDNWTMSAAEITYLSLLHPNENQKELGTRLGISQSSVSQRQKTAHFNELVALNSYYQQQLAQTFKL